MPNDIANSFRETGIWEIFFVQFTNECFQRAWEINFIKKVRFVQDASVNCEIRVKVFVFWEIKTLDKF